MFKKYLSRLAIKYLCKVYDLKEINLFNDTTGKPTAITLVHCKTCHYNISLAIVTQIASVREEFKGQEFHTQMN